MFHQIEETLEDADPHPTHLDLKADHIFFDSGAVCFIDMESCALADPVLDPAMLAARLDVMPDILPVCRDRTQRFADVFLDEYFSGVPKNWQACFPAAYKCAALKVALYFLQHQVDGWQDRVASTLVKAMRRAPE